MQVVSVGVLLGSHSPRLNGEDLQHVQLLASSGTELPPIVVHRPTMRVIDGMHRLRAAQLLGRTEIKAEFFDGTDDEAFILAVRANTAHGLPLSLADREAAAARLIGVDPRRSDRWIAAITGLAPGTVSSIRRRTGHESGNGGARIGRDGRVRPVDSAHGRRIAWDALAARPDASLREIARVARVSPSTVRDVRKRMLSGDGPVPAGRSGHDPKARPDAGDRPGRACGQGGPAPEKDRAALLRSLRRDPSLRFSDAGRKLLHWLDSRIGRPAELEGLLDGVPAHCAYTMVSLARQNADEWLEIAARLEQRTDLIR
jgi:DNA-binding CsgD family transcriptional regulator